MWTLESETWGGPIDFFSYHYPAFLTLPNILSGCKHFWFTFAISLWVCYLFSSISCRTMNTWGRMRTKKWILSLMTTPVGSIWNLHIIACSHIKMVEDHANGKLNLRSISSHVIDHYGKTYHRETLFNSRAWVFILYSKIWGSLFLA